MAPGGSLPRRRKLFIAVIGVMLALLLLLLFRKTEEPAPPRYATTTYLPDSESLREGDYYVYFDETPLSGRPAKAIPVCKEIYDHVELDLDGRRVGDSLLTLKAGTTVDAKGGNLCKQVPRPASRARRGAGAGFAGEQQTRMDHPLVSIQQKSF